MGIFLDGRVHPFGGALDLLRFRPCGFLSRLRLGLVVFYLQKRRNWQPFMTQTARQWMARACGADAMRTVWDPLLKGKFDKYCDAISMAWLWARIHIRANSRQSGGGEQLGYFRGGFAGLTEALRRRIEQAGGSLRTSTRVEALSADQRQARINGVWENFDACVFTGPSGALARLLPEGATTAAYAQQLNSIQYLGAICLVFSSDQAIGSQYWLNVNEPGAPFLVFIRHTRLLDAADYGGREVYYIGAYVPTDGAMFQKDDATIAAEWWAYLKKIYPDFDPARVQERHVFKFRGAQHIVDTGYAGRIPDYRTPLPGVYLANFSQVFPEDRGTNFAVREGRKIAAMVAGDLTQPPR
jgi:protoporphyrinogen oxidase